ncbi:CHAT domain-containing protein [Streptomyces phyllanthi]|uniref:CHAT domain-containing protein n=2 Tax=Streptomyces phyllanthi TaxID=1803180 RepID=A0A5N8VWV1_9ACTN|nr:CHAT domain-containing protein [Streptomyces phyllanthi]MPY39751.1 CHAT domain-containing protein [Streptomyces phyllanthi]
MSAAVDRRTREGHQLAADLRVLAVAGAAGTTEGIDDAYADVYGALALDVPGWLTGTAQQLGVLLDERWRLRRTSERIPLLRTAVRRATDEGLRAEIRATLQRELADALIEGVRVGRAEAFEEAVGLCDRALEIYTPQRRPHQFAHTSLLASAVQMDRIFGDLPANHARALAHGRDALRVFDAHNHPVEHADAQSTLGIVHQYWRPGERRASQEQALACYTEALELLLPAEFPHEFARTQNYLATAWWQRQSGSHRDNLEEALTCLRRALDIWTPEHFPVQHARLRHNMAIMYLDREHGSRGQNVERALHSAEQALRVFTEADFLVQYGQGLLNTAEMYLERTQGDRSHNVEEAIDRLRRATGIRTRDAFPNEYAVTQAGLAQAFRARIAGTREDNLRSAATGYREALSVWTLEQSTQDMRDTSLALAEVHAELGEWEAAGETYRRALEAEELLLAASTGISGQDAVLRGNRDAATRYGYTLHRLGHSAQAALTIEKGRAQSLTQALSLDAARPEAVTDPDLRHQYTQARAGLSQAHTDLNAPLPPGDPAQRRRTDLDRMRRFRTAKEAFDAAVTAIRRAQDPPDFLHAPLSEEQLLATAETFGPQHAIVYLAATPWGGIAAAVLSGTPHTSRPPGIRCLDLPDLTTATIDALVETTDQHGHLQGGYAAAQSGRVLERIIRESGAATLEEHARQLSTDPPPTLRTALTEALAHDGSARLATRPFSTLTTAEHGLLSETLAEALLRHELTRCLDVLGRAAMRPLVTWLTTHDVTSMILIPCGRLAAFPLASALLDDGRSVSETMPTSTAPNARSLAPRHPAARREGLSVLGDPAGNLPWGEAEALALHRLAGETGVPTDIRTHEAATRDWLLSALRTSRIVTASCHGSVDPDHILASSLHLARQESLLLGECLSSDLDLGGLRLLVLSACQTAAADWGGARDEVRNLAAAMMQAGAQAVLGSLWAVDDRATYLLMTRFAQQWLPAMSTHPPSWALAGAQHWLRTVTNAQLSTWESAITPPGTGAPRTRVARLAADLGLNTAPVGVLRGRRARLTDGDAQLVVRFTARHDDPSARPYEDPFYWAGFQLLGH